MTAVQPRPQAQMFSVDDVASLLSLSSMTVYRFIHAGQLRAYRFGRQLRVRRDDFEEFMGLAEETRGGEL